MAVSHIDEKSLITIADADLFVVERSNSLYKVPASGLPVQTGVLRVFPNVATLTGVSYKNSEVAYCDSYFNRIDGGHGFFRAVTGSTESQNSGTILPISTGRLFRQYIGPVYVPWFGSTGNGVGDDYDAINNSLYSANSIYFPSGRYNLQRNLSIPSNKELIFDTNAILSVSPNVNLYISGTINAGLYQIFSGNGNIYIGDNSASKNERIPVTWFGADATNSVDSSTGFLKCFNSINAWGQNVYIPVGNYDVRETVNVKTRTNVIGDGIQSIVRFNPTTGNKSLFQLGSGADTIKFSSLYLRCSNQSSKTGLTAIQTVNTTDANELLLDRVYIDGFNRNGVLVNSSYYVKFIQCRFANTSNYTGNYGDGLSVANAIYLSGGNCNYVQIDKCRFFGNDRSLLSEGPSNQVSITQCAIEQNTSSNSGLHSQILLKELRNFGFSYNYVEGNKDGTGAFITLSRCTGAVINSNMFAGSFGGITYTNNYIYSSGNTCGISLYNNSFEDVNQKFIRYTSGTNTGIIKLHNNTFILNGTQLNRVSELTNYIDLQNVELDNKNLKELTVSSNSEFNNQVVINFGNDETNAPLVFDRGNGQQWSIHNNNNWFNVRNQTSSTDYAAIDTTGFLGLGLNGAVAGARLDVNGQIRIRGGSPGNNKALFSDGNGLATWETLNTGIFLTSGSLGSLSNVVYTTGNQTIIGIKEFQNPVYIGGSGFRSQIETTGVVTTTTGWNRVSYISGSNGRGQQTVTVYTNGGDYNPISTTFRWWHDWTTLAGITCISEDGLTTYWTGAKITDDGSNSFLEVFFSTPITGLLLTCQYDGGNVKGALFDGNLAIGSGNARATTKVGYFNVNDKFYVESNGKVNIPTNSLGYFSGDTNLGGLFAGIPGVGQTGQTLFNYITTLSGNLITTGQTVDTKINSLSGNAVLTSTNQTVNGEKFFVDNLGIGNNLLVNRLNVSGNAGISGGIIGTSLGIGGGLPSGVEIVNFRRVGAGAGLNIGMNDFLGAFTRDIRFRVTPDSDGDIGGYLFQTRNGANGDINALTIVGNGNVGVNHATPTTNLSVSGGITGTNITGQRIVADKLTVGTYNSSNLADFNGNVGISGRIEFEKYTIRQSGQNFQHPPTYNVFDFNGYSTKVISITGSNLYMSGIGYGVGRELKVLFYCNDAITGVNYPAGWKWINSKPTGIPAQKGAVLTLTCTGTTDSSIFSSWGREV